MTSLTINLPQANQQIVTITSSTCHNLSLFKDLMKEYRRLDDTVTMRLNRATAQFMERDRTSGGRGTSNAQDEACAYFWTQLVENWKKRQEIVKYCVEVMDKSIETNTSQSPSGEPSYAEMVKRRQIYNELTVENIIRKRSIDAFKTRCKYFEPPLTDVEARAYWNSANQNR